MTSVRAWRSGRLGSVTTCARGICQGSREAARLAGPGHRCRLRDQRVTPRDLAQILAVMPRATLGHTGRPLMATPGMIAAWLLIPAAAVVRAFGPVVMSGTAAYAAAAAL
ncbi:NnrS family protein [Belnapia rosea]|uniref:NnrS family protein n=1 Tax=Belnapia rosea TaxID=938405 RepID=UPI000B81AF40